MIEFRRDERETRASVVTGGGANARPARDRSWSSSRAITAVAIAGLAAVYLFVTAPPPLPERAPWESGPKIPAKVLLDAANIANAAARRIYTERIVSHGQEAGLAFAEDWRQPAREAGPLPALFLRLVASALQERGAPLGLFLGSDHPINPSNGFKGEQLLAFDALRQDRKPRYFEMTDDRLQVALYADVAVAAGCVACHNAHPATPKRDWQLGEVMGATTWTYPRPVLSDHELRTGLAQVVDAIEEAYRTYLDKTRHFTEPPAIGPFWPGTGERRLPDPETFMAAVKEECAAAILNTAVLLR
jgi:hypothetical protein